MDPDRNTIQMDLSNKSSFKCFAIKSARADLPADFTEVINIITKDFPTNEELSISIGTSFNPNMHFGKTTLP